MQTLLVRESATGAKKCWVKMEATIQFWARKAGRTAPQKGAIHNVQGK